MPRTLKIALVLWASLIAATLGVGTAALMHASRPKPQVEKVEPVAVHKEKPAEQAAVAPPLPKPKPIPLQEPEPKPTPAKPDWKIAAKAELARARGIFSRMPTEPLAKPETMTESEYRLALPVATGLADMRDPSQEPEDIASSCKPPLRSWKPKPRFVDIFADFRSPEVKKWQESMPNPHTNPRTMC